MTEIEEVKAQIKVLEKKLSFLEEIEKQPRMNLQQEGEYAVVSYHNKVYYRLEGETTFSWYIKKGVSVTYPVPTLVMVNDAETERLLEGIYYNHIQVKKEKEQRTKTTSVEEAFKDYWGEYPETENRACGGPRWEGFQAGYNYAQKDYKVGEWEPTPQTPEQVADGLKEAFREAVKQGVVSSTKSPTLYDLIAEWWEYLEDTLDMDSSIKDLVNDIEEWLPTEHDTNSYKWNECIRMIREKLR